MQKQDCTRYDGLQRFVHPESMSGVIYTAHRSETSGIAERAVGSAKEETSTPLVQS